MQEDDATSPVVNSPTTSLSISHKELPPDPPSDLAAEDGTPELRIVNGNGNGIHQDEVESPQSHIDDTTPVPTNPTITVDTVSSPQTTSDPPSSSSSPPEVSTRIAVPKPDIIPDPQNTSGDPHLPPTISTLSQVSLSTLNEVPLHNAPPSPQQPKVPAKDIPFRPTTASPAPLASPVIRDSRRSSATFSSTSHSTVSVVHIMTALDAIAASKEGKRAGPLKDSCQKARELIQAGNVTEHRDIFEPLRLACETRNEKLMITSLDCIQKLVSHSFLTDNDTLDEDYTSPPASPTASTTNQATSLADLVTTTITSAHTETTPDPVSLQIVKALLSLILSNSLIVHHSSLLKAVRTVYNVFLLSVDSTNQMVAQGALTQMVNHCHCH